MVNIKNYISIIMDLASITKSYFSYFSNKDITNLSKLYSEDVRLKDWEIDLEGKDELIKKNIAIFNELDSINPDRKLNSMFSKRLKI